MSTDDQQLVSVALYHVLPAVRSLAKNPAWRTHGTMPSMRFLPVTMAHRSRDILSCRVEACAPRGRRTTTIT